MIYRAYKYIEPKKADCYELPEGATLEEGDYLAYGKSGWARITPCKYDPGCCVGGTVPESRGYYRELSKRS